MLAYSIIALTIFASVSSAMLAGIYFIFSNTVMPSLRRIVSGPETMQLINRIIQNPGFFTLFFGSFISSNVLIAFSLVEASSISIYGVIGSALLISTFISTVLVNVPLNNDLDKQTIDTNDMNKVWTVYLDKWIKWNHIRTLLCICSSIFLAIELLLMAL